MSITTVYHLFLQKGKKKKRVKGLMVNDPFGLEIKLS